MPDKLRQLEAALRELQNRLHYVEQATPLGLWDWNVVSGRIDWSPGLTALYGLPPDCLSANFDDFMRRVHPADAERVARECQAVQHEGRPFDMEFRILRPDGSVRWLASRARSSFGPDGTLLRASGLNIDVTEARARAQHQQLQQSIIDNMAEGLVLCSADSGRILHANRRYETIQGYGPGELVGLHGSVVNSPAAGDPMAVAQTIVAELHQRGEWLGTVRNRRKDGRDIWVRVAIANFKHDELGPVWVNVCSDVTETHLAQQASEQASAELHRLAARTQEVIEAERAALSRDLHDQLGAALTGMRMRLEALAAQLPPGQEALAAEANAIARMARAATEQTRDICSRLRPPALDDLGIVETCRWTLGEWAQASGVKVARRLQRLPEEPPPGVAIDLFRMLQELLTNVARHARARQVNVSLTARTGDWVLSVADDGQGFDPRLPAQGFGLLGLRERAQRHGGRVELQSGPSGTSVHVFIPRGPQA